MEALLREVKPVTQLKSELPAMRSNGHFRLLIPVFLLAFAVSLAGQEAKVKRRLYSINQDGKHGYIDATGAIVIRPRFRSAHSFSEGLAAVEADNGKCGYVDESGKTAIEFTFSGCEDFSEGLAAASVGFRSGYIDRTGKWVIQPKFVNAQRFSDGLALVGITLNEGPTTVTEAYKRVFIDRTGKVAINLEEGIFSGWFSEGFANVALTSENKVRGAIIDKNGKVLIENEAFFSDGFSDGLAVVEKNGKFGFIDKTGQFVIQPIFNDAGSFSEGLAAVQLDEVWGYIDHAGKIVIRPQFYFGLNKRQHAFSEGLAFVMLEEKCGYINRDGKIVIEFQCIEATKFNGDLAFIFQGSKRAYINKQGKFVWGPTEVKPLYATMDSQTKKAPKEEEKLSPLTESERRLNPRDIVANQPDFVADMSWFYNESFGGLGGAEHLARKGNKYREESQFWLFIGETGKPAMRVNTEAKMYNDLEPERDQSPGAGHPFDPRILIKDPDMKFSALGAIDIDGHRCVKIEAQKKGDDQKVYLYAARDLKNLAIVGRVTDQSRSFIQKLSNISLDVPDSLVNVPADYKPIEHERWTRVENARVTYNEKPSKDFCIFRSPTGELFIRINDAPYPWDYLVRPKLATVETAYQGMLVTRQGKFIWETKENEAFSDTSYHYPQPSNKKDDSDQAVVGSNSVRFRSNNYTNKNPAMIEVQW